MSRCALDDLLAAEFSGEYRKDLASITGARSDREIAEWVERLVREQLGSTLRGATFVTKSVGAVFGLELGSAEHVVLKLFPRSCAMSELDAMQRLIERAVGAGFPAPMPRSRLFVADDDIAGGFYAFVDGELRDAHEPEIRHALARSLADLVRVLEGADPEGLPLAPTRGDELWPAPHRSFLDLAAVPESKWIDEIGARARAVVRSTELPLIAAHLDWGVKNARFRGDEVCAVYDWDSLFAASEAEMVGRAAAQFTAQWEFAVRLTPSRDETRAFVHDYERARGRAFTGAEHGVIAAAAEYVVAQVTRLELASGAPPSDGFLALLREIQTAAGYGSLGGAGG